MLDGDDDFKLLATLGFAQAVDGPHSQGTTQNSYAWSMEWFKGALLVGTLRQNSTRAQIWRYTPAGTGGITGTWKMVYQSSRLEPADSGYRWMTVCDVGGAQRLFVATWGSQRGRILYSDDGITFRQASTSGLAGDIGYRPLVCFRDPGGKTLLITSPVGVRGDSETSNNPIVLATDDPIRGTWRPYSPLRFGDPDNDSIFSMGALDTNGDGYGDTALYAGTFNYVGGSEIWKTSGCSPFPCVPAWKKIVDKGAGRPFGSDGFVQNAGVSDIVQHHGAVYASFSDSAGEKISAELIRINPDDSFELVIGQPRFNVDSNPVFDNLFCSLTDLDGGGTANDCPPLSGRGAGFGKNDGTYNDGTQYYFWQMLSYDPLLYPQGDDRLYVGTLEGTGDRGTPGFDLLATSDNGLSWVQVTTDGIGDPSQSGARTIVGSPLGIFIGGANWASKTKSATNTDGCDVWLGTCDPALAGPPVSDPRAVLKSAMPGQVVFDGQRYIAYYDGNYPNPGDSKVAVTLESRSYDPFCGDIIEQKWDKGDLTGSCGSLSGNLSITQGVGPLTLCTSSSNAGDCPDFTPSASTADYNEYTFTLQVTDNDNNMVCNKVVVRASKNLPPNVNAETDPPAVLSEGRWYVSLVDFNRAGSKSLTLRGICTDPESLLPLTCTWSADPGVNILRQKLPFADADPAVLGTSYTATLPTNTDLNIVLTSIDNLGNKTALPVEVKVRSTSGSSSPRCQGISRTITKNTVLIVNPATDTVGPRCADPNHQTLSYVVTQPSAGTGTTTDGANLTYTPPPDFVGTAMFTLQACNPDGRCSDVVGVRVSVQDVPPLGPPSAPLTASATVLTGRTVRVTWTDVANETRYEVQRCKRNLSVCSFSTIASNLAPGTTHFDNMVTSAGSYRFRVRACNARGCSSYTLAPDVTVP